MPDGMREARLGADCLVGDDLVLALEVVETFGTADLGASFLDFGNVGANVVAAAFSTAGGVDEAEVVVLVAVAGFPTF